MKHLTIMFAIAAAAAPGLIEPANAESANRFFFEGDMVRGDQAGAPGPFCVLNSQFKRLEKVVWRVRVLDAAGKPLDDKGLKSLEIELPDGQKIAARFGPHPPPRLGPAADYFWSAAWIIPGGVSKRDLRLQGDGDRRWTVSSQSLAAVHDEAVATDGRRRARSRSRSNRPKVGDMTMPCRGALIALAFHAGRAVLRVWRAGRSPRGRAGTGSRDHRTVGRLCRAARRQLRSAARSVRRSRSRAKASHLVRTSKSSGGR